MSYPPPTAHIADIRFIRQFFISSLSGDSPLGSQAAKKKKPYHHGNLRQSLVQTAVDLISERQHSEFTLRELAKRLGVTHAATYHHFKDKEELLAVVAKQGYTLLGNCLKQNVAEASPDAVSRMRAMGIAYLRFALDNQAHFRVMFSHKFGDLSRYPEIRETSLESKNLMLSIIQEGQQQGLYIEAEPTELIALQWASLHGLALLTLNGHFDHMDPGEDLDAFFARTHQHLIQGTATPKGIALFRTACPTLRS